MLGSPLLRAAIALAVLLVLLLPLRSFTAPRARAEVRHAEAAPERLAHLELVSTKSPFTYSVAHLGKVIWHGTSQESSAAADLKLPVPKEGIDLALDVEWTGPEMAAAKLVFSPDDGDASERTIWGEGKAADVVTFP